jgi:hypothetical protein
MLLVPSHLLAPLVAPIGWLHQWFPSVASIDCIICFSIVIFNVSIGCIRLVVLTIFIIIVHRCIHDICQFCPLYSSVECHRFLASAVLSFMLSIMAAFQPSSSLGFFVSIFTNSSVENSQSSSSSSHHPLKCEVLSCCCSTVYHASF